MTDIYVNFFMLTILLMHPLFFIVFTFLPIYCGPLTDFALNIVSAIFPASCIVVVNIIYLLGIKPAFTA